MKRLLLVAAVVASVNVHASAWEFKDNPDRRPSWAFGYSGGKLSGIAERTEIIPVFGTGLRDTYDTPTVIETQVMKPSIRLPLSDDVTIDLDYTYTVQKFDSSNALGTYKGSLHGSQWGGTFRKYF